MAAEREILTYEMFGTAVREIAQQVVDSGFEPDLVLSVARGGMGLGMGLGYALDVKNISAVNVEFYTGVDERLEVPIMLPPSPSNAAHRGNAPPCSYMAMSESTKSRARSGRSSVMSGCSVRNVSHSEKSV